MGKGEAEDKGIEVYPGNPHYWQFRGEPVLLLGGSVEDNLFQMPDLARELDTLVAAGGNYLRCTMSSRDEGNVWPFAMGDGGYDLDRWNEEYWRRFEEFLAETHRRGIVVQVEVWATFDFYREPWERNPFNPKNTTSYTAEETGLPVEVPTHPVETENSFFWSVPAERNQRTVLKYQRRFVDTLLSHALRYDHVLWCMDNETSVTPEWGWYWAEYVGKAARRAGRRAHRTEMWDPWELDDPMHDATFDHPEVYSFVEISQNNHQTGRAHYQNALRRRRALADEPRPLNNVKIYGADGGRFGTTRDAIERFWRNIFVGCASARFHRPDSGIGLSQTAQQMIRAAREVTARVDVFRCEPRPDLVSCPEDGEAYCLAASGQQYAVYLPAAGSAELDLGDAQQQVGLRWYEIDAGRWGPVHATSGPRVRLEAPGRGQWVALVE